MRDVITEDGEQVTVYDDIQITTCKEFYRGGWEQYPADVGIDGGGWPSDGAITQELAEDIHHEVGIDVRDHGVTVVDMDEVDLI